jgi:hypothetical protein
MLKSAIVITVEEVRKVLQDFPAPELRSMNAEIKASREIMEARFREVEALIEAPNDRNDGLKSSLELDRRVERLESRHPQHSAQG